VRTAVLVPGDAPPWVEDFARHVAQRLTRHGRVLVAFTDEPSSTSALPGRAGQGSVFGYSVAGYPLWMGRRRAVLGVRRRQDVAVLVLWNGSDRLVAVVSAVVARVRGERLVLAQLPDGSRRRMTSKLLGRLAGAHVRPPTLRPVSDSVALVLCGSDMAFADEVLAALRAMPDAAAHGLRAVLQVAPGCSLPVHDDGDRHRTVTTRFGEASRDLIWSADIVIAPYDSGHRRLISDAVLHGGSGILVGGPVAGRILRQPDGVWLSRCERAALIVALEAAGESGRTRPLPVEQIRNLAEDVVSTVEAAT